MNSFQNCNPPIINQYEPTYQKYYDQYRFVDGPSAAHDLSKQPTNESTAIKRSIESPLESTEKQNRVDTLYTEERTIQLASKIQKDGLKYYAKEALKRQEFNKLENIVLALYIQENGKKTYEECRNTLLNQR